MIAILLLAVAVTPAACHSVEGEQILGRDLAAADGRFALMPPDATVGYAPSAGARRILHPSELARVANRYSVPADVFEEVCFDRAARTLDREKMIAAMQVSLALPQARLEITEWSLYPAPAGELVFPRAALTPPHDGVALWRGYVRYGMNRRFPVWARVKIQVSGSHILATEDLKAGVPIEASQLRLETFDGFPGSEPLAQSVEQVTGLAPRRRIHAGSALALSALEQSRDVVRGERVSVEVHAGAAQLAFEGRAESTGRTGQTVSVLNTKSGKKFDAQVAGKGRVVVSR
ncbi:MAG: flagellar basal body P-ring formation chaperone FlgA [Acidobacteriota bacterium]|nr:flagellar basal body P-ring formation chaperone FlgA [Acidobacteriota bacterium]